MNSNAAAIQALRAEFEASKKTLRAEFEALKITMDTRLSGVEKELRTLTTILKARQIVHGAKKDRRKTR